MEELIDETPEEKVGADDTTTDAATEEVKDDGKSLIDTDLGDDSDSDDECADGEDGDDDSDDGGSEGEYVKPDISDVLGEGAEFDDELFGKVTPILKNLKASQEDVDAITRVYAEHVKQAAANHGQILIQKYNEIKDGWKKESMTEFKANFKETLNTSGQAIKKFGSKGLIDLFNETGVGNHKEVIACFAKIGKYFAEDTLVDGDPDTSGRAEDVLYTSMK